MLTRDHVSLRKPDLLARRLINTKLRAYLVDLGPLAPPDQMGLKITFRGIQGTLVILGFETLSDVVDPHGEWLRFFNFSWCLGDLAVFE